MSDGDDGPPEKLTKFEEMSAEFLEDEMDEGQEEWLSEEVLTDDDYTQQTYTSQNDSQVDDYASQGRSTQETHDSTRSDIEQMLNDLDKSDVEAFFVTKPAKELNDAREDGDGNDTDDLLRLLGDEDKKGKKKLLKTVDKETMDQDSSDGDDEYIFESAKLTRLKVAKNAIITNKRPMRAEPEDSDSDLSEASWEEASTVRNMFGVRRNVAAKSTAKQTNIRAQVKKVPQKTITLKATYKSPFASAPKNTSASALKSILKPDVKKSNMMESRPIRTYERLPRKPEKLANTSVNRSADKSASKRGLDVSGRFKNEPEELLKEARRIDRLPVPEQMDEDMFSDEESSISEDESLYDELPSTDSEDLDEWFSLDIRAEKAGNYLPLLGDRALQVLLEQKEQVGTRLSTLRQSLASLTEGGRQQAEQLRQATLQLAELDDMLKVT